MAVAEAEEKALGSAEGTEAVAEAEGRALGSTEGTEAEALTFNIKQGVKGSMRQGECWADGEGDNSLCRRLGLAVSPFPSLSLVTEPLSLAFGTIHALDRDEAILMNELMRRKYRRGGATKCDGNG